MVYTKKATKWGVWVSKWGLQREKQMPPETLPGARDRRVQYEGYKIQGILYRTDDSWDKIVEQSKMPEALWKHWSSCTSSALAKALLVRLCFFPGAAYQHANGHREVTIECHTEIVWAIACWVLMICSSNAAWCRIISANRLLIRHMWKYTFPRATWSHWCPHGHAEPSIHNLQRAYVLHLTRHGLVLTSLFASYGNLHETGGRHLRCRWRFSKHSSP